MTRLDALREAIEALPIHGISGYEWECWQCHYHFVGRACHLGHGIATADGEFDAEGRPCQHSALLDRDAVLRLIDEASR